MQTRKWNQKFLQDTDVSFQFSENFNDFNFFPEGIAFQQQAMFPWSFSVFNCTSCTNQFEALKSPRGQFDTGNVKSLHQITCVLSFNMEVLKGREFTFTSRWLRRKGPQEKHYTWSCLSPKKLVIKSNLGWGIWTPYFSLKGWGSNLN